MEKRPSVSMFGRGRNTRAGSVAPLREFSWRRGSSVCAARTARTAQFAPAVHPPHDGDDAPNGHKPHHLSQRHAANIVVEVRRGPREAPAAQGKSAGGRHRHEAPSRSSSLGPLGRGSARDDQSSGFTTVMELRSAARRTAKERYLRQHRRRDEPSKSKRRHEHEKKLLGVDRSTSHGSGHETESTSPSSHGSTSGSEERGEEAPSTPARPPRAGKGGAGDRPRQRTRGRPKPAPPGTRQRSGGRRRPETTRAGRGRAPRSAAITETSSKDERAASVETSRTETSSSRASKTAALLQELRLHRLVLQEKRRSPRPLTLVRSNEEARGSKLAASDSTKKPERASSTKRLGEKLDRAPPPSTTPRGASPADCPTIPTVRHNGFRSDYRLGDPVRDPSHVLVAPAPAAGGGCADADVAAASLRVHDYAFLKRSDGKRTYAILAHVNDKSMTFVVDAAGNRKRVGRRRWGEYVGGVASEWADDDEEEEKEEEEGEVARTTTAHDPLEKRASAEEDDDDEGPVIERRSTAHRRSMSSTRRVCPDVASDASSPRGGDRDDKGQDKDDKRAAKKKKEKERALVGTSVSVPLAADVDEDCCSEVSNMSDRKPPLQVRQLRRYCDALGRRDAAPPSVAMSACV